MKDKDGRVTGWFGSATDIDDQKRAEEALRESEERFRKVFEEGPIGILLVGTDGCIQHVNRRFCEMLGYSEERNHRSWAGWHLSPRRLGEGSPLRFTPLAWRNLVTTRSKNAIFAKMASRCGLN